LTRMRLTIDFSVANERRRSELMDLQLTVMEHAMRLGLSEYVKVTLVCNETGLNEKKMGLDVVNTNRDQALSNGQGLLVQQCANLSERQRQIACMLCEHYSVKRIAEELFVSENTVKKHIQNIKKALQIDHSGADFVYTLKQLLH
jgi:DNA-binding NarL/FixJ family response regulator